MAEYSKCPHCGLSISKLKLNRMPAEYNEPKMQPHVNDCMVFSCPHGACGKVIFIQYAYMELARLIADAVLKKMPAPRLP